VPVSESPCPIWRKWQIKFLPCRPQRGEARHKQDAGQPHADTCTLACCPAERCLDEENDRNVLEKVDAVGKQTTRPADSTGNYEHDAEIGEVQHRDEPDHPVQTMVSSHQCHATVR
jgi:hypothetical protein